MKKPLLLVAIVGFTAVIFFAARPGKKEQAPPAPQQEKVAETAKPSPEADRPAAVSSAKPRTESAVNPADNEMIAALRKALSAENHEGLEDACNALRAYIEAHPENVQEYVEFMRSEKDEHVLRQFALVLAGTEVGLLENEEIIKTAIELAKDSSFEQRQHIMLHLMSDFPEMRDDVLQAIMGIANDDPNSQVKTSGVVTMADWMDRFPDQSDLLLEKVGDVFKTSKDPEVLVFTYQILALHKEQLQPEMFNLIGDRLKNESDPFSGNLLACALFAAPDSVRLPALQHAQSAFDSAIDEDAKRNFLLQVVCLSRGEKTALLQQLSEGNSLLAEDARGYLATVSGPFEPQQLLAEKAVRDGEHASCSHPEHQKKN